MVSMGSVDENKRKTCKSVKACCGKIYGSQSNNLVNDVSKSLLTQFGLERKEMGRACVDMIKRAAWEAI